MCANAVQTKVPAQNLDGPALKRNEVGASPAGLGREGSFAWFRKEWIYQECQMRKGRKKFPQKKAGIQEKGPVQAIRLSHKAAMLTS
jgi:hypothetical protein